MLIEKGYTFKSETDTEVVAQLFEDLYDGDMVSTTRKLLEKSAAHTLWALCVRIILIHWLQPERTALC